MEQPTPERIKEIFDPFYKVDINLWTAFTKFLHIRTFEKNEIIKDYNKTEKYINILISGSAAHFVLANEKDVCINLYYENQIFSDYLSFLTQSATVIKTQALEDAVIWSISHHDLNELYSKSQTGLFIGKAISDAMFIRKQSEQINLLTLSPTERYLKLIKERPEIFQRTSLKILCSYLGITAESLSRIRKKII
ncbi:MULTISPECIES: cyclic nucleotide-binding domain-containing protein [unclassified Flavobacterium]|uniref:Crp/Fnr family transcriptional regulator n=1 Tax=unclassified Flavobacterium TaxID=196869 RepID=UPI0009618B68|nr:MULTISPECIES: cyclic nucleotide-binding domain-containing protein [unclassified Flavobacterium]MBN9284935.1 Crp/Fnr family transcriptional regulator [Flavobacterium sp.]OJV72246.1 MAG: cyclic nucleotide-binding protein [Flavobacterium sp. 40-81]